MELDEEDERLATILIVCFKYTFKFEFESEVYRAATVSNIGKVNLWINKSFCRDVVGDGLRSLKCVYLKFFYEEKVNESNEVNSQIINENQSDNDGDFLDEFLKDDEAISIELELDMEIKYLTDILSKQDVLALIKTNISFCSKHQDDMPRLSRLAILLSNLNASSAYIEIIFLLIFLSVNSSGECLALILILKIKKNE
ncbi:hypothetical protein BpHYR1_011863 [Brachionus plicatilis]|uniref:Uncharacterized protein n=1 Tax=Brachionus plicatilis TaxID=10195 RepID=A0A3M7SYK4_BRAPC|nr:hypothetical protein BpHYR1_011863 [Brachionus plicatilis]